MQAAPHNPQNLQQPKHTQTTSLQVQKQKKGQNLLNSKPKPLTKQHNNHQEHSYHKIQDKKQQQEIDQQIQVYKDYFNQIQKKHKNKYAHAMRQLAQSSVCVGIKTGQIKLSQQKHSLDELMYQSRIKQLKKKQDQQQDKKKIIQMQLKYLDEQISMARKRSKSRQAEPDNQFIGTPQSNTIVLSRKQHHQFLQKILKQRSELSLRKKTIQAKQKIKLEEQMRLKRMAQAQNYQKQKQQKKKKILQKIQQNKLKHQQKQKQQQEYNRRLSQVKQKKSLHQKIQQKYTTKILLPTLQQRKKKLKQIRQMSKAFNVQQINNHQKEYVKKRQQVISQSHAKNLSLKQQWNYKIPQKTQKLAKLLQQQSLQAKLKLQQKKRKLEQKIQRQQQFAVYLKERQPPTIDLKKRQQIQKRLRLKSQQKQKPDRKTLGISYLQEVKQQRKKSSNSQMQFQKKQIILDQTQQGRQTKKAKTNYLPPRKSKQQYQQLRQKRIQQIIHSDNKDKSEKIMKLQIEAAKLIEQQKRKQQKTKLIKNKKGSFEQEGDSTNLLLASIKAKMGIIDLYNNQ